MPNNLIMWGDSHAEGGASALRARDMGIAGKQLSDLRAAYPPSSIPRGSHVAIQIGTNDLTIHSGWSDSQIRNHAGAVIRTAVEMRNAGATPTIFAVPIPERPYSGGNWTQQTLREFQENARIYNNALRDQARAAGINFINFQPNPNDFSSDNLHLNRNGYSRMYASMNGVATSPRPDIPPAQPTPDDTANREVPSPRRDAAVDAPPLPPPTFTPTLNTALTAFLTGDASAAEITALKGAVSVTDSDPPGRLHGQGGVNGALTLERARTALGGSLSATNHPELYALATARYAALTGLPADRAATPAEIDAAEARVRNMTPEQRAEYQSVSYLLGFNDTRLSNGQINVDGIYGTRTESSIATANARLHPAAVSAAVPVAPGEIEVAATANARTAFPGAAAPAQPAIAIRTTTVVPPVPSLAAPEPMAMA